MSVLDNWKGESNAQHTEQEDNAYVSRAEHERILKAQSDRLVVLDSMRKEWAAIPSKDWKAIKEFIDGLAGHPLMPEFMETAERKAAGLISMRMSPKTYYQLQIINTVIENDGLADFVETMISNTYNRIKKAQEAKQDD